jgi:hypothetical protein
MDRVTRRGGALAAAIWDFRGGLVYQRIFWDTAAARDPEADHARARHFSAPLTRPGELAAALRDAGLRVVRSGSLTIRMDDADFADYWEPIADAQGPVGDYVNPLAPEQLKRLAAAVRRAYLAGAADRTALDGGSRLGGARRRSVTFSRLGGISQTRPVLQELAASHQFALLSAVAEFH